MSIWGRGLGIDKIPVGNSLAGLVSKVPFGNIQSGVFSPKSLSGLLSWHDAQDGSTITQSGGDISQWDDKSGNGHHATQATAVDQPIYNTSGINGLPAVEFDGLEFLTIADSADFDSNIGYTLLITLLRDSASNSQTVFRNRKLGSFGARNGLSFEFSGSAWQFVIHEDNAGNYRGISLPGAPGAGNPHYITTLFESDDIDILVDGVDQNLTPDHTNGTVGNVSLPGILAIGAEPSNFTRRFNGKIGEIIWYKGIKNSTELAQLHTYSSARWGI